MRIKIILVAFLFSFGLSSCSKNDSPVPVDPERTVFVYMPWSTDLLKFFKRNLQDLKTSIVSNRIQTDRFIVFISESSTESHMFEYRYNNGKCDSLPLKVYTRPPFTTADGITAILDDMMGYAPAPKYSMVIGSHGLGWIPVSSWSRTQPMKYYWDYDGEIQTRFFGGRTPEYQTDITTLAEAIGRSGIKMEYILFDDCYMSCIEAAYDLKDATDYLIGCPTEIMAYGFPYHLVGKYLTGTVNYEGVADAFHQFYSNYSTPCGTIAVTRCSELENLAAVMKEINGRFTFDTSKLGQIQRMDGYTPVIFFDYGDYVAKLCSDPSLLASSKTSWKRLYLPAINGIPPLTTRRFSGGRSRSTPTPA